MPDRTVRLVLAAMLLAAGVAQGGERPAPARPCPDNLPEGAHLPPQPGCDGTARSPGQTATGDRFQDLGNGVSVRMNGRAGAEFGVRR